MYLSLALGEKVLPRRDAQKTQHTDQISFCNSIGRLTRRTNTSGVSVSPLANPRAPNKFTFRTCERAPISIKWNIARGRELFISGRKLRRRHRRFRGKPLFNWTICRHSIFKLPPAQTPSWNEPTCFFLSFLRHFTCQANNLQTLSAHNLNYSLILNQ